MDFIIWPFLSLYVVSLIFFIWFTSLKENVLKFSHGKRTILAVVALLAAVYAVSMTLWIIAFFLNDGDFVPVFLYGYAAVIIYITIDYKHRKAKERGRVIKNIIEEHIATLSIKRKQLLVADEYGVVDYKSWGKEITRFHDSVVAPRIGQCPDIIRRIETAVLEYSNKNELTKINFSEAMTPYEYERYCADLLCDAGWLARATKASGDQGSDVIATKGGIKIVLQCKLYTKPVGNKAVQEIYTAKQHEQADYAAVVTNQTYTRSARQISSTTGVALLHHAQIKDWANSLTKKNIDT